MESPRTPPSCWVAPVATASSITASSSGELCSPRTFVQNSDSDKAGGFLSGNICSSSADDRAVPPFQQKHDQTNTDSLLRNGSKRTSTMTISRRNSEEACSSKPANSKDLTKPKGLWKICLLCRTADIDEKKVYPLPEATNTVHKRSKSKHSRSHRKHNASKDKRSGGIINSSSSSRSTDGSKKAFRRNTPQYFRQEREYSEGNPMISLPEKRDRKPCLVLDLDETLVNSTFNDVGRTDFKVTMKFGDQALDIYVTKRPFLDEFLETMADKFEIGIFTASLREYAEKVIEQIDPKNHIKWSIYRDSCTLYKGYTVKNLEAIPRRLDRIILVDDRSTSFMLQRSNGVQCSPFEGAPEDTELKRLEHFLCDLSQVEGDLREFNNITDKSGDS